MKAFRFPFVYDMIVLLKRNGKKVTQIISTDFVHMLMYTEQRLKTQGLIYKVCVRSDLILECAYS